MEDGMEKAKALTVVNYIVSGVLWFLGLSTLLCNLVGLWQIWHLAGFGFVFHIPLVAIFQILALYSSCKEKNRKMLLMNVASSLLSIAFVVFTIFVSSTWFW